MAYPFRSAPTVRAFVERLVSEYGCKLTTLPFRFGGPRGGTTIQYLIREYGEDGKYELHSEPLPSLLDEMLSPDTARRLIVQLKLPREAWIWAGDPYELPADDWPDDNT